MSYKVIAIPHFRKRIKKLAKKHPSLKEDLAALIELLQSNPRKETLGTAKSNPLGKTVHRDLPIPQGSMASEPGGSLLELNSIP